MRRRRSRSLIFIKGRLLRAVGRQREMTVMSEISVGVSKPLNLLSVAGALIVKATRFFLRGTKNTVRTQVQAKCSSSTVL